MDNKIPIRFFIVTFIWTWLFFAILIIIGNSDLQIENSIFQIISVPIIVIAAFGPGVGAIYSVRTLNGKGSVKIFLKSFLSLKFGWKVWFSIIFILGFCSFISWILPEFFGVSRLMPFLPSVFVFPVYLIFVTLFGGGQEEIGWNGYIYPFLEKKFNCLYAPLIMGIIWSVWHLPLWFITNTLQSNMNFLCFTLMVIGYAYFHTWIVESSGYRSLSGLISHGTANAYAALFPYLDMNPEATTSRFWIYSVLMLFIGLIIGIYRYKKNNKNKTAQTSHNKR